MTTNRTEPIPSQQQKMSDEHESAQETCLRARRLWLDNADLALVEAAYRTALMATKTIQTMDNRKKKRKIVQVLSQRDYRSAGEKMALLLCQSGRAERATAGLQSLGYSCRLARHVLDYPLEANNNNNHNNQDILISSYSGTVTPCPCRIYDHFLSATELQHLQTVFLHPSANYWTDHQYHVEPPSPYFSYLIPTKDFDKYGFIGRLMKKVYNHLVTEDFKLLKRCTCVEMWAHNRPHASGHQLHFDSDDEGRGGVRNPIISTILYLTDNSCGGPSLVTNQTLVDTELASQGWLAHPKKARLVAFDGRVLHGVIPGKGQGSQRRVTLMFAFWRDIKVRKGNTPGAARSFPTTGSWTTTLRKDVQVDPVAANAVATNPIALDHVYEKLDGKVWTKSMGLPDYDQVFQGF